jgi:hypothetical protein
MPENKDITLTLSPATAYLVRRSFQRSTELREKETLYMREAESYVEFLINLGLRTKESYRKSSAKAAIGSTLREALDKFNNKQPLTTEETSLVKKFFAAAKECGALPSEAPATT